eukprot:m.616145 g.616145  ORF g.616145 m.616145 type:complete len:920 (+) comp22512_c0_seq2:374-3133(+)
MAEVSNSQSKPISNSQSVDISADSISNTDQDACTASNSSAMNKEECRENDRTVEASGATNSSSEAVHEEVQNSTSESGTYDYGEDTDIYKAVHGHTATSTLKRVKVYHLDSENWADMGTGQVHTETSVNSDGEFVLKFKVICEETGKELVSSSTDRCSKYLRQQDTLIVWSEPNDEDLALSFQEKDGCTAVWSAVCKSKGVSPVCEEIGADDSSDDDDDDSSDEGSGVVGTSSASSAQDARYDIEMPPRVSVPKLPPVELGNLEEIKHILSILAVQKQEALTNGDRELRDTVGHQYDTIADRMLAEGFIDKIIDLFHQCEDLEDATSLASLGGIVSGLFSMCNNSIFEIILSEKHILDVIGMFEYLPGETQHSPRVRHRDFLKNKAVFKDVLAIDDKEMIEQIHSSYRIRYIRDVILSGMLDDMLQSTLASYIYYCTVEVHQKLREHPDFLTTVMRALRDTTKSPEAYRDSVLFLKDLCTLPRSFPGSMASACLLDGLVEQGLLSMYSVWMAMPDKKLRLTALEVLNVYVSDKLSVVRQAIIKNQSTVPENDDRDDDRGDTSDVSASAVVHSEDTSEGPTGSGDSTTTSTNSNEGVLAVLAKSFVNETDLSFLPQIMSILRSIVDTDVADAMHPTDKTKLLQIFYEENVIGVLMEPLSWNMKEDLNSTRHEQVYHALGLLAFAIPIHTYFVKNYVMRHGLLQQAMQQLESNKSILVLAALRLLRVVVWLKNEFYNRHIIKCALLSPAIAVLRANGPRYTLRYSCVLEVLEFIRKENIKSLVQHLAEAHKADLEAMTFVSTTADLLTRHEQNTEVLNMEQSYEPPKGDAGATKVDRRRRDTTMDAEEELYWEDDEPAPATPDGNTTATASNDGASTGAAPDAAEPASGPPQFRKRLVDYDEDDDDDALFKIATKKSRDES